MKYTFKDMLNAEIYDSAKVMFVTGPYSIFNNMVSDELKERSVENSNFDTTVSIGGEFGFGSSDSESNASSNSVDFNTFIDVIGVANINGKWFCRVDFGIMTKKQKELLFKYIREPSDNGTLVVVSENWKDYSELLRNKLIGISNSVHLLQLSFPSRNVLKTLVEQLFNEKGLSIDKASIDMFIIRMSSSYEQYDEVIDSIKMKHPINEKITVKDMKVYMKGIENFIIDDFLNEILKPMSSDKTNNKKVLRMMSTLENEMGARTLVNKLLKLVDENIEFRLLINQGIIPIGINYFFGDVIKSLGETSKYAKMNEWIFRKKALTASQTSLRDWQYIKLMLFRAVENVELGDRVIEERCKKALYEVCTRSVITPSRINNIIGIENVLSNNLKDLDNIRFEQSSLDKINSLK